MIVAFDSSALVKMLVPEVGSDIAENLWLSASQRVASALAFPETIAALVAARRAGRLTPKRLQQACDLFVLRWDEVDALAVTDPIVHLAGELVFADVPLSGADAVHLATAIDIREDDSVFATWDKRLSRAARLAGLAVAP